MRAALRRNLMSAGPLWLSSRACSTDSGFVLADWRLGPHRADPTFFGLRCDFNLGKTRVREQLAVLLDIEQQQAGFWRVLLDEA